MIKTAQLYDFSHSLAGAYLQAFDYPWQVLSMLKEKIVEWGEGLDKKEYDEVSPEVWVHKKAVVAKTAFIGAPCIIGEGTEVRHCAFIRGGVLVGKNCVVGNSTEVKNSILFDEVQVPHYNYVGDSILGFKSHMGAGSITSNVKSDRGMVAIKCGEERIETGLKKVGAMLGDGVEIGCNAVLNPGTIIGKNTTVYPLSLVRGVLPENGIYKGENNLVKKV